MDTILEGLNQDQLAAVTNTEGYLRVIAGAGTGKTRTLTRRYAYLVDELGISTANILCITFTNKAANEMKRRIRALIGDNDTGFVCTIHGFCVQLLREDIHTMNYPQNFIVMDGEDTEAILKNVYESVHLNSRHFTFSQARDMIEIRKNAFEHIPYLLQLDNRELKEKMEQSGDWKDQIFYGYLYEQKKCYGLDFADLLTFTAYILRHFEEKRSKWQERLMYVMVDEFQDVDRLQYEIIDLLSGYHRNLFVVGDPDQTIYTWRGADISLILNFDQAYPGAQTYLLTLNYRSTPNILMAANSLIQKNKSRIEKELAAVKAPAETVIYHHAETVVREAAWITGQIKELLKKGVSRNDIAILYRSHHVSRSIEEWFIKEQIRYILYSGTEFYKRKEIKDILSYLRMIAYADDLSFLRTVNEPRRNIGTRRIALLKGYAELHNCSLYIALKQNMDEELFRQSQAGAYVELVERYQKQYKEMKLSDLVTCVLNESGYEAMLRLAGEQDRLDNLSELKQSVFDYETNSGEDTFLEDYLERVALFTNADQQERADAVKMMTVHTAKGLEFPYVFLCGMNEGIFPTRHVSTADELEEERRLSYVAYTRAEQGLFLSDAEGVNLDGTFRYPSRFLFNTDKKYLKYTTELEDRLTDGAAQFVDRQESKLGTKAAPLQVGDKVSHKVFGPGIILEIQKDIASYTIQFEKMATVRNISYKTKLEKIQ